MAIAAQQHGEIVKPSDNALQFYTIYQKYSNWGFVFANVVQEHVLDVLAPFRRHYYFPFFFL